MGSNGRADTDVRATDGPRIIAMLNQKGGVGKTTTAVNLGAAIAQAGYRCCLVDLDPQAHLTLHLGIEPDRVERTVYDLLVDPECAVDDALITGARPNLDTVLAEVDLAGAGVTRTALESFDPSRSMAKIEFADAAAEQLGEAGKGVEIAERVLNRAAVLLAFEQVGSASRAFELTRDYTLERFAFGRPIASFQAIKHKLADRWCDIEIARSNSYYGAWALEHDNDELPVAACLSRVAASEAFDAMSVDMIQLHGGVGFTWEFDCHMFYRRARLLSTVLGNTASWKHKLVDRAAAQEAA